MYPREPFITNMAPYEEPTGSGNYFSLLGAPIVQEPANPLMMYTQDAAQIDTSLLAASNGQSVPLLTADTLPTTKKAEGATWQCWDDGSPDPCHADLSSVDMLSSTDGWAVGYDGAILHWDGSSWTKVASPTDKSLGSIKMVSTSDGWAVGRSGTILHWEAVGLSC